MTREPVLVADTCNDSCPVEHGGSHVLGSHHCPDCGRYSADSWLAGPFGTQNGTFWSWGGVCGMHGYWSEQSA